MQADTDIIIYGSSIYDNSSIKFENMTLWKYSDRKIFSYVFVWSYWKYIFFICIYV